MAAAATEYIRSFWPRVCILLLALFALLAYLVPFDRSTLVGIVTPQEAGQLAGDGQKAVYLPYRPDETPGFVYISEEDSYISSVYVPYDTIVSNVSARPYEIRWPGDRLSTWASKPESGSWKEVPKGKHICYVSVGKAAGSSVSSLLGFQLHGPDVYFIPSGMLPHYTTHIFHGDVNNCADDTPYYLFLLRHPLQRAQSAFAYDRDHYGWEKGNQVVYKKCAFKNLNTLAAEGLAEDGRASNECKDLAYDLIRGYGEMRSYHLFCNYQFYYNVSFAQALHRKDSQVLVIRSEHLEDDWNKAERTVVGERKRHEHIDLNVPHLNVHDKDEKDLYLSEKSQVLLCDALCEEIQMYKRLLREAVNLDSHDYAQSMAELKGSCPVQVGSDHCI